MTIFASERIGIGAHLSVWMNRIIVKIAHQPILGAEVGYHSRADIFLFMTAAHKSIFYSCRSPLMILPQHLFQRKMPSAHIVEVKPKSHVLLLSIADNFTHFLRLAAFCRIGILSKFRPVPIGVEHQMPELIL